MDLNGTKNESVKEMRKKGEKQSMRLESMYPMKNQAHQSDFMLLQKGIEKKKKTT